MKSSKSQLCRILIGGQICFADSAKRKEKQFVVFMVAVHLTLLMYVKTGYQRLVKILVCTYVFVCFCFNAICFYSWPFNGRTCWKNHSVSTL